MRYHSNGSGFTVSYSARDADRFAAHWPASTVDGAGSFSFTLSGDLIDATGSAAENDGSDWLAFSEDCHRCGMKKHNRKH